MKKYSAIFFDWDGTAVLSRNAPVDNAVAAMHPLLENGIKLAIISGTTIENIAGGKIESYFTKQQLENLYLGLGRGAYNYCFIDGKPQIFQQKIPEKQVMLDIHRLCFAIHLELKDKYGLDTDVVFSRPNYCKIDLMTDSKRGDNLFMQENEVDLLKACLRSHGIEGGLKGLLDLSESIGRQYHLDVVPTCDAKYLEVGISSKSDNVRAIFGKISQESKILPESCSYWGDEYVGIDEGVFGSDSFMCIPETARGDFFDVSEIKGERPKQVKVLGGGIETFLFFLKNQK